MKQSEELFKEMRKYKIPDVVISKRDWDKYYKNLYSVLNTTSEDYNPRFIYAVEDMIRVYLLLEAKKAQHG